MFHKLRRHLTMICTIGTAFVLIGLSLSALFFSLSRLRMQFQEAFHSNLNTVFYYLQAQPAVDQAWLSRTEADGGLLISIQFEGQTLRYTGQEPQREKLTTLAEETAQREYGYDPLRRPDGLNPTVVEFELQLDSGSYRAAAATVPYRNSWLNIVMLKNRTAEIHLMRQLCIVFAGITGVAIVLLALFAYYFTGRAIQPVQESHRKQQEFVSSASHELRSPLAVIRMGVGLLRRQPERNQELADKIEAECTQMSRLVDDLLLLARADDNQWSLLLDNCSPKTLLLTAYERFEGLARDAGVTLEPVLPEEAPTTIRCDEQRIGQVLTIFLDNALRYTPSGGTIRLGLVADRHSVHFKVDDSGPGIPDAEKELVFDRFYRSDASRTDTENHGLGLAVAKEIAMLHGGSVNVRDSVLGGAMFVLKMPPL